MLLWLVATIVAQGLHGTAAAVRDQDAPAFTDATEAQAVLSDADRAAWQSFRSGEAQLTGPGQQYQNDITTAGQDLERLAALAPSGTASQQLQTVSGQLVNYQGLVEQADAANRADIALGNASGHDLGYAYLTYSSSAMRDPQGGLLASISGVTGADRQALDQGLGSWWGSPVLLLAVLAAAGWLLWSIIAGPAVPAAPVPPDDQPAAGAGRGAHRGPAGLGDDHGAVGRERLRRRAGHGAARADPRLAGPGQRREHPGGGAAGRARRPAARADSTWSRPSRPAAR